MNKIINYIPSWQIHMKNLNKLNVNQKKDKGVKKGGKTESLNGLPPNITQDSSYKYTKQNTIQNTTHQSFKPPAPLIKLNSQNTKSFKIPMYADGMYLPNQISKTDFENYKAIQSIQTHVNTNKQKYVDIFDNGLQGCKIVPPELFNDKVKINSGSLKIKLKKQESYMLSNSKPFSDLLEKGESISSDDDKAFLASMIVPHDCSLPPLILDTTSNGGKKKHMKAGKMKKMVGGNKGNCHVKLEVVCEDPSKPQVDLVNSDHRRDIFSICCPSLKDDKEYNYGHFVLKAVHNDKDRAEYNEYADNYQHESIVYHVFNEHFKKHTDGSLKRDNVVNMYVYPNNFEKIDISESPPRNSPSTSIPVKLKYKNQELEIMNLSLYNTSQETYFLLLENTYNHYDFSLMIQQWEKQQTGFKENVYKGTQAVLNTLYYANQETNFIHGDLHSQNVKIDTNFHVKLFDFDYSAHLYFDSLGGYPTIYDKLNSNAWDIINFGLEMINPMSSIGTINGRDFNGNPMEKQGVVIKDNLYGKDGKLEYFKFLRDRSLRVKLSFLERSHPCNFQYYFKLFFLIFDVYRFFLSAFLPYYKHANNKTLEIVMDEFINGIHDTATSPEMGAISSGSSVLTNTDTVWLEKELNAVIQNTTTFNTTQNSSRKIDNIPTVITTDKFFKKFKEFTMNREVLLQNGKLNSLCSSAPFEIINKLDIVKSFTFPLEFNKIKWPCANNSARGGALYTKIGKAKIWVEGSPTPMLRTIYNKGKSMYIRNINNSFSRILKKQIV
jgi:hypothetical protein